MEEDLISVVIPIYNVEKLLKKCILSVINQEYKNLEIILVDDGSTDSSGIICDEIATIDNRIKVIHKENGGLSSARNAGIDIATGKYIGFVDSDDYIDKRMYKELYNSLKNNDAEIAVCSRNVVDEQGKILKKTESYLNETMTSDEALIRFFNFIIDTSSCDKLFDIKLFNSIRFPIGKQGEDRFIMHKLIYNSKKVSTIQLKGYNYVQREGSITKNKKINKDGIEAVQQHIEFCKNTNQDWIKYAQTSYAIVIIWVYNKFLEQKQKCPKKEEQEYRKKVRKCLKNILKNKRMIRRFLLDIFLFVYSINIYKIYYFIKKQIVRRFK